MAKNYHILILLILFGLYPLIHCKLIGRFHKITCGSNLKRLVNGTCGVKAINRFNKVGYFQGVLLKPTYFNRINFQLFRKSNGWHPFLLNFVDDACRFFKYGKLLPYMDFVYNISMKYTNFNHTCPFEGTIIAENLSLNDSKIYDIFPAGEYRINLEGNEGKEFIGRMEFYGSIIESGKALK